MDARTFFSSIQSERIQAMRNTHLLGLATLAAVMLAAGGCNKNKDDQALLREESANLRAQLEDRNAALAAAENDRRELAMQNAELRRQLDAGAGSTGQTTGFEGIAGVSSEYDNGEVTVTIASDVLFDSGRATLKEAAKRSLEQVASVLKSQYGDKEIRISGHTDTDPIARSGWKSNYHLGAERAYAVMEFLRTKGVNLDIMHIASFGPSRPAGSKAASRRVEIAVLMNT